jgi:hypothetical protein
MARVLEVQDYGLALLTGALNLQIWVRARVRARAYVSSHVCVCVYAFTSACLLTFYTSLTSLSLCGSLSHGRTRSLFWYSRTRPS